MRIEIKSWLTGRVLFEVQTESWKVAVELAVKSGADLSRANLSGADLSGADLSGANLYGANLSGANLYGANNNKKVSLIGDYPVFQITPIGSRQSTLVAFNTSEGILVRTGCFYGSLDSFVAAVKKSHSGNQFEREYLAAVELIKVRFSQSEG